MNVSNFVEEEMKGIYQSAMTKHKVSMLLVCVFISLLEFEVEAKISSPLEREIEAKLKLLNKPAVKTIKVCNFPYNHFNIACFVHHILLRQEK